MFVKLAVEHVCSGICLQWNLPMLLFWLAMYGYCLAGILALDIHLVHPWFLVLGISFAAMTVFFCVATSRHSK